MVRDSRGQKNLSKFRLWWENIFPEFIYFFCLQLYTHINKKGGERLKLYTQERCKQFLSELKLPVTRFCTLINISPQAYYKWIKGELNLSIATVNRIDQVLNRYGF